MNRTEIDLREKIAAELEAAAALGDGKWAMMRAIGVVRAPLNHNSICPCSLCDKWQVKSCSDECNQHRRITEEEAEKFIKAVEIDATKKYDCGWCNGGHNAWAVAELLWDKENEFPVTPCCHTEATEALDLPEPEEYDQRKDDEASYRWSVLGR